MPAKTAIYLDANAGGLLRPLVARRLQEEIVSAESLIANPSSLHAPGRRSRCLIAGARSAVAKSLGTSTDRLLFTSSGTESNQTVLHSILDQKRWKHKQRPIWALSRVEHDCVFDYAEIFESWGGEIHWIEVDSNGLPKLSSLDGIDPERLILISLIWVNNETGVISDVAAFASRAREWGVPLHIDAAQAWGKLPIELDLSGASYVAFSSAKTGALPGSGVLWTGVGAQALSPAWIGTQEQGRRGGTENVLGIATTGWAAEAMEIERESTHCKSMRDLFESELSRNLMRADIRLIIHGAGAPRVCNTSNFRVDGVPSDVLLARLDLRGVAASAGAACSSGTARPSRILQAMGLTREQAKCGVRVSLDPSIGGSDVLGAVQIVSEEIVAILTKSHRVEPRSHATVQH